MKEQRKSVICIFCIPNKNFDCSEVQLLGKSQHYVYSGLQLHTQYQTQTSTEWRYDTLRLLFPVSLLQVLKEKIFLVLHLLLGWHFITSLSPRAHSFMFFLNTSVTQCKNLQKINIFIFFLALYTALCNMLLVKLLILSLYAVHLMKHVSVLTNSHHGPCLLLYDDAGLAGILSI